MYMRPLLFFLIIVVTGSRGAYSQLSDTTGYIHRKSTLLPVTMVAYGVAALHTPFLGHWNQDAHKSIAIENPDRHISLDNYLQWSPAIAVYGLNLAGMRGRHNFRDRSFILGIATLLQGSAVYAMKNISKETRPDHSNTLSFPSGHTATAFAAAEFMRMEYKDVSPWYGIAGYTAAAATGYLRMYNNKHWLSDVIAGAGVGILSTEAAYYLYPVLNHLFHKPKHVSAFLN
jgi:membrane-associated phospholipid phosphatase